MIKRHSFFILMLLLCAGIYGQTESGGSSSALSQVETEHYVVVFQDDYKYFAHQVVIVAEEIWSNLVNVYGLIEDYQKIHIYIQDPGDYAQGMALASKNSVIIYTTALNFGIRGTSNWIRNVLTHELAHVFSIKTASKDNFFRHIEIGTRTSFQNPDWNVTLHYLDLLVPRWWSEGIAQYEAYKTGGDVWDTHRDMFLRMAALEDDLLDYVEMGTFWNRSGFYGEMTYNQGYSMVLFVDSMYGEKAVRQTAKAKSYFTFNRSLKKAIGKNGQSLYMDWQHHLKKKYGRVKSAVGPTLREGARVINAGYWDHFGVYSPDGRKIAFVSNKGYDITFLHLFVKDVGTGKVRQLTHNREVVDSRVQWFPEGDKLLYSRGLENSPGLMDIFIYDLDKNEETPITWRARALDPALSPDGSTIAYIKNDKGIQNLALVGADGRRPDRLLTHFNDGTQLYSPCWAPDGNYIIVGIFKDSSRDIAVVSAEADPYDRLKALNDSTFFPDSLNYQADLEFRLLVSTSADERDPVLSPDGEYLYYASDRTGIFNIYRMNLETGETGQVTNVLGGAFSPSLHPARNRLLYTGFHAANYSLYEMPVPDLEEVEVPFSERDYSRRFTDPLIFSESPKDAQYRKEKYKPKFTMWDLSPFVSFEPAFITDTVGFSQLMGGLRFETGELAGYSNLNGRVYAAKDFRDRAGVSWGIGLDYDKQFPFVFGENKNYYPEVKLFGSRNVIKSDFGFKADPITKTRVPDQAFYTYSDPLLDRDIDTLYAVYADVTEGYFLFEDVYDWFGGTAQLKIHRKNTLGARYLRRNIFFNGDIYKQGVEYQTRIYELSDDRLSEESMNEIPPTGLGVSFTDEFDGYNKEKSLLTTSQAYRHVNIYNSHQFRLLYTYEDVRPAFFLPVRADIVSASAEFIQSRYSTTRISSGSYTSELIDTLENVYVGTSVDEEGRPIPEVQSIDKEEDFFRFELFLLERFPLYKKSRHFFTFLSFFGSLNRKLPNLDKGNSVFPLQYRIAHWMQAYPYGFKPIELEVRADSFEIYEVMVAPDSSILFTDSSSYMYYETLKDTQRLDILAGNRILYAGLEYTHELCRDITFAPLGMLVRAVQITPFIETAAVWNTDFKDFSMEMLLGKDPDDPSSDYGDAFLSDFGLRLEVHFRIFENWESHFYFIWAQRLDLDDRVATIDSEGYLLPLDKNRFKFGFTLFNF
jgi:hypothetical protein